MPNILFIADIMNKNKKWRTLSILSPRRSASRVP